MKILVILISLSIVLSACISIDTSDPGGFTSRAQIRAQAQVDIATQDRLAREAEAKSKVDLEAEKQYGENHRAATWAMIIPVILIILGVIGGVWMIIYWKGRIAYTQAILLTGGSQMTGINQLPQGDYRMLEFEARRRGSNIIIHNGIPMLQDKHTGRVRQLTVGD
jgi:hypothetical protein